MYANFFKYYLFPKLINLAWKGGSFKQSRVIVIYWSKFDIVLVVDSCLDG